MNNKLKVVLIIIAVSALGIACLYFVHKSDCEKKAYNACLEYTLYDPEKQAYRWKFEFVDEWFRTHEDAMKNCLPKQKEAFCF